MIGIKNIDGIMEFDKITIEQGKIKCIIYGKNYNNIDVFKICILNESDYEEVLDKIKHKDIKKNKYQLIAQLPKPVEILNTPKKDIKQKAELPNPEIFKSINRSIFNQLPKPEEIKYNVKKQNNTYNI